MIKRVIKLRYFINAILLAEVLEWDAYVRQSRAEDREIKRKRFVIIDDYLTTDNLAIINKYYSILQFFKEVAMRLQGNPIKGQFSALWEVLLVIEFLLGHLKEVKDRDNVYLEKYFKINIRLGQAKLNKYYILLDNSPVYITALVLHPAYRWNQIKKHQLNRPK